jgi:hypothetical protein
MSMTARRKELEASLTAEYVRELLHYEIVTGRFYWKRAWTTLKANSRAGSEKRDGYRQLWIHGVAFVEHRLAHLWVTGRWPKDRIDHINRETRCNGWHNLREATVYQNMSNTRARSDNKSGFKGISFDRRTGKWSAGLSVEGKRVYLGYFDTAEEAGRAAEEARNKYHGEFACHLVR